MTGRISLRGWRCMMAPALLALLIGSSSVALAEAAALPTPLSDQIAQTSSHELRLLTPDQADRYRVIFTAVREQRWADATALLASDEDGPLRTVALAEIYLAKGSPRAELPALIDLLVRAPELPQADQLARLAKTRGATEVPLLPITQKLSWLGGAPRRERLDSGLASDPVASKLQSQVTQFIKADLPGEAEAIVEAAAPTISPVALSELRYIIAWSWYGLGNDDMARAVAGRAIAGNGNWAVQAHWIVGLAAWRQQDCNAAATAFSNIANGVADRDLRAAGHFWAARAELACGRPQNIQMRMRLAAGEAESFYGMLAAQYLGLDRTTNGSVRPVMVTGQELARLPNIRAALALMDIDEPELADRLLRHQARIGNPTQHVSLINLAASLNLPNTQLWLAQNGPAGARLAVAARYPLPSWNPANGWRVDRSLLLAHSLQESNFRPQVVSPAGAQGLMQLLPSTAALIARARGETVDTAALRNPAVNMEYGQSYLETLRDQDCIGGLLPKAIAAYNAGPTAVARWNMQLADQRDPLLYIESIPYWETRSYVMIVLRNYWMYQKLDSKPTPSLTAMAQGMWPRFPGMPGKTAMRITREHLRDQYGD